MDLVYNYSMELSYQKEDARDIIFIFLTGSQEELTQNWQIFDASWWDLSSTEMFLNLTEFH